MKWQPPIPAGAFCSREAIKINSALPLLGYCYDQIGRDGWLTLNLHEVAGALDVPYHTVRKWWTLLRGSAFIADVDDRGRGGMRIRIANEWIDWRILALRPTPPTASNTEMEPNSVPISDSGEGSKTKIVPDMASFPNKQNKNGTEMEPNSVPKNLHIRSHPDQESPPPPNPQPAQAPAGGGGGVELTETERFLIAEGFQPKTAREFRLLDLEACRQSIKKFRSEGTQIGGMVLSWRANPPQRAPARASPQPIQPPPSRRPPDAIDPAELPKRLIALGAPWKREERKREERNRA